MDIRAMRTNKNYKIKVKIDPMPNSCYECPFFYMPNPEDEGGWYEHWNCFLHHIRDRERCGIALKRYKNCPLENMRGNETSNKGKCIECPYKTDTCQEGFHCSRD